jgi:hypothetical protein
MDSMCFGHGHTILHNAGDRFRKMRAAALDAQLEKSNGRYHDTLNVARSTAKKSASEWPRP